MKRNRMATARDLYHYVVFLIIGDDSSVSWPAAGPDRERVVGSHLRGDRVFRCGFGAPVRSEIGP
jgi:hypothetical protein